MNPYQAYRQNPNNGQLRIDVVLALYEKAIDRIEKSLAALERGDKIAVQNLLPPVHLAISALAGAIDKQAGELGGNLLRLFEFVSHCLKIADRMNLRSALNVLRTLHEGFVTIRPEAVQLERSGEIVSLDRLRAVEASA